MTDRRVRLASYKLRFADRHVRAVPATGLDGAPFVGPGVDVRGEDADSILALASSVLGWLDAREPGVRVRSFSLKLASDVRALISLEPSEGSLDVRPRALRVDPPLADDLRDAGREVERAIEEACVRALTRRAATTR